MNNEEEFSLKNERKELQDNYKDSLKELRKLSSFLKNFINMHKEMSKTFENNNFFAENQKEKKSEKKEEINQTLKNTNSIIFSYINNIYDSFEQLLKKSNSLFFFLENDLVKPLDEFIENQLNFYNQNLSKMDKIKKEIDMNKIILDNSKNNYYTSSIISSKLDSKKKSNSFIRGGESDLDQKSDNLNKNKMITRIDEFIYNYEIIKYNKNISSLNKEYDLLIDNAINLEKTKVHFVQAILDKYKKYLKDYEKLIDEIVIQIEKDNTKENGDKEENYQSQIISKYKNEDNNNLRFPKNKFNSFQQYLEYFKPDEKTLKEIKICDINPFLEINDNDLNNFIKELVNELLGENEVGQEKLAKIYEYLHKSIYDVGKKILNYLYEKKGVSTIVFLNLKNLEHLSNILGYITLHQSSIFNEEFDLNFKIIYIAEKIFYLKKLSNDKIYLNALLSKNKYYRTKEFWRNIIELKLAIKINDHIKRIKNLKLKEKSKGGLFSKMFKDNSKKSFLVNTRIFSLLKEFNTLDSEQIELINKIAIQEMQTIIRVNIPIFANFNFPSEQCIDLIAQIMQEYKIDKENIKYFVTYLNVSSYTIRRLFPNEKRNTIIIYNEFKQENAINKKLKLFKDIVPFLEYKDYNNLLLCSKLFHKKLSKVIYNHILSQKNISKTIRLSIWQNLLGISELKKNFKYKEILQNANEERVKHEIELDVVRTTVGEVENPKETREQITNVLYAVSQLNGPIKYCQGMNFVVQFLYEIYGEEDAFYIFLAFFKNTEYNLIFTKELEELKILFYVFKRIISLLEPELYSYFKSNGIDVNFFASPWFITLFTGSHQKFKGENDNSQILLRILDNYILSGLKSIMEVGCVLLHSYENILMSKRYEDMMQFLINDLLRSDFFSKKNEDKIEEYFKHKINKKLIKNIKEEYRQEEKLKQSNNK